MKEPEHHNLQRVTIAVDGAPLTIMPRRAPVGNGGPIRGHTLAIFPDPPVPQETPHAPERPGEDLRSHLPDRHCSLYFGTVQPGSRAVTAVRDLSQHEAVAIGQALGLAEILFWDGRRANLLACNVEAV